MEEKGKYLASSLNLHTLGEIHFISPTFSTNFTSTVKDNTRQHTEHHTKKSEDLVQVQV